MHRPITLVSGQWTDLDFSELCERVSGFGYDGIEIACWGDHFDPVRGAVDSEYSETKRALLRDSGLDVWALSSHLIGQCVADEWTPQLDAFAPAAIKGNPERIREWAVSEMKSVAKAAACMGVSVVTGFMGSPIWPLWYGYPPVTQDVVADGFRRVRDLWSPIFDEFDAQGVRFGLEVHPTEIAYDFYTWERLLQEFEYRPTLGLNLDPSHLIWQGVDPVEFIRQYPDRIYHIHLKDVAVRTDGRSSLLGSHLPFGDLHRAWNFRSLGRGDVDFEELVRHLNSIGYRGPLSVEWEDNGMDRDRGAREACDFARQIDIAPSTVAFDESMHK